MARPGFGRRPDLWRVFRHFVRPGRPVRVEGLLRDTARPAVGSAGAFVQAGYHGDGADAEPASADHDAVLPARAWRPPDDFSAARPAGRGGSRAAAASGATR